MSNLAHTSTDQRLVNAWAAKSLFVVALLATNMLPTSARSDQCLGESVRSGVSKVHVSVAQTLGSPVECEASNCQTRAPTDCGCEVSHLSKHWRRYAIGNQPQHVPYRTLQWYYYFRPYNYMHYGRIQATSTSGEMGLPYSTEVFDSAYETIDATSERKSH